MSAFPSSLPELLCELIARPSVTPEGDSGGTPANETLMADYVAELLRELGGQVSVTEVQPGRPNVVARFPAASERSAQAGQERVGPQLPAGQGRAGLQTEQEQAGRQAGAAQGGSSGRAPVVALVPHLDTVGVAGMTVEPFTPLLKDGRIYGRGASDTKGPMAAALWALRSWLQSDAAAASTVTWVFAATMGEEEMSTGASALCASGFKADFAIALEPTDLQIVRASKGVLRVWARARGVACHSSTPHKGQNAIYKMLPFLDACAGDLSTHFAAQSDADLGAASLNLGVLQGGGELNIVPDACCAGIDVRTHPAFPNAQALECLQRAAEGIELAVHRDGPPYVLAADNPWLRALLPYASGVTVAPWFSDANVLNAHGTPAVAFGPGKMAQAHTKDEYIALTDLEQGAAALEAFIRSVSAGCVPG